MLLEVKEKAVLAILNGQGTRQIRDTYSVWIGEKCVTIQTSHVKFFEYFGRLPKKGMVVDHINGDSTDNSRVNLRETSVRRNNLNRRPNRISSSKYKNVFWDRDRFRYGFDYNGERHYGPSSRTMTEEEAGRKADSLARSLLPYEEWIYYKANFPEEHLSEIDKKKGDIMISVVVVGNLGADAEVKSLPGGTSVLNFRLASNSKRNSEERTTWVSVSLFGERATKIAEYLTKGKQVVVRGSLETREYTSGGKDRTSLEVRADDITFVGGGDKTASPKNGSATVDDDLQF